MARSDKRGFKGARDYSAAGKQKREKLRDWNLAAELEADGM
jgi:hypothetical protein